MDPFTQRMLERAKSRREKLDSQKMILEQRSPLQEKINLNENAVLTESGFVENRKGKQYITPMRKSKLQKLAQFYSTNNENVFLEDEEFEEEENVPCDPERKSQCKLGRLDELASKIKQWEDDLDHTKHHATDVERNSRVTKEENSKKIKANDKQTILDSSMVEKLCSQGFSRSESQSRLLYEFKSKKGESQDQNKSIEIKSKITEPTILSEKSVSKTVNPVGNRNEVLKKAALFESSTRESPKKSEKDPAELSLAERKALFERNKGEAVLPKNPFFLDRKTPGKPVKLNERKENRTIGIPSLAQKQMEEKRNFFEGKVVSKKEPTPEKNLTPTSKAETCFVKEKQAIPEPPPMPVSHHDVAASSNFNEEKKEVKTFSPKSGRLYPSLSNLDITDESVCSYVDSFNESKNSNLCLNMTLSELLEMNKNNPKTPPSDLSFSQSKECQVLNKMDKLLEEALNDISSSGTDDEMSDMVPSPPKMKKSSSFEYKSGYGNPNPLLHTVSFYRKQQQNSVQCVAAENLEEETSVELEESKEDENESILVQNKIKSLSTEVSKQQTIISQASQALNLCLSTVEFSGSGEQVEGERLLLLASHKRQACLNEIQRLKVENTLRPQGVSNYLTERGDVILTNISIKLKRDALRSITAADNLQYFVCLIKSDEQVLATPAVPATKENLKDMALQFPGQIKLESLLSNFKVAVEVYNLELGKELLPHDVKYHLVNKKEKKLLTPIKNKKSESKLVRPNIQSPAGPNAVRTSNFQLCGYIVFSLREISRTQWILNKVPYVSPVEGTISITIQSQLRLNDEFRGFLTMFDDISGFGAWHRRWCLLSSHFISYWKYPDDETKKVPIGTIDLRSVITENIGVVSRDICARLNTFLLETTRPRLSDDKNSLVVSVKDDITTIRHLLSADSKQEMMTWCKKLNTALALLRSWKCNLNE